MLIFLVFIAVVVSGALFFLLRTPNQPVHIVVPTIDTIPDVVEDIPAPVTKRAYNKTKTSLKSKKITTKKSTPKLKNLKKDAS